MLEDWLGNIDHSDLEKLNISHPVTHSLYKLTNRQIEMSPTLDCRQMLAAALLIFAGIIYKRTSTKYWVTGRVLSSQEKLLPHQRAPTPKEQVIKSSEFIIFLFL